MARLGKREREAKRDTIKGNLTDLEMAHELWKTFEANYDRCVRELDTLTRALEELKWLD